MANAKYQESNDSLISPRPLLKWAGGKTQMLTDILPKVPAKYNRYVEPFVGGGALFFSLNPTNGIIADSNPELINMYKQVADNVEDVINSLLKYDNSEGTFYSVRAQNWESLSPSEAAARLIFLNKTCFNGLYRVNRKGQFNVPFGHYKNPKICDYDVLLSASELLKRTSIICGDYLSVLKDNAQSGDFIFLDPPYLPISEYSDFKRYTKEQFYEEDHSELAQEVKRLHELGCHVLLTNSNHPLVHDLYNQYHIDIIQTKRYISCNGNSRKGEDVIVTIPPKQQFNVSLLPRPLPKQIDLFPATRYMGSKTKLLKQIWAAASQFEFSTVLDLFSGSGIVGYMFKTQGKEVITNDYMAMSTIFAKAMIENKSTKIAIDEVHCLLNPSEDNDRFVSTTFEGLYFTNEENQLIDNIRANIANQKDEYKRSIAMTALIRACIKKRPRGIFTYTGDRYDDGRKDLKKSFQEQFLEAIASVNAAVFDNGKMNKARNADAMQLRVESPDLVYIDPPYYSPYSDNEYVRRYHFVEGLARNWVGVEIQKNTQTKKFKSYPTPFSTRKGAANAFDLLFKKYEKSILIVSYSSNSLPTLDEMVAIIARHKEHVEVIPIDHRYSFGNQANRVSSNNNKVQEYLFVGY